VISRCAISPPPEKFTLPRNSTKPEIILALSISAAARALGVRYTFIANCLDEGKLVARKLGSKVRIPVFGDRGLQELFNSYPEFKRKS
jgi:excisionase family DNA binding protein